MSTDLGISPEQLQQLQQLQALQYLQQANQGASLFMLPVANATPPAQEQQSSSLLGGGLLQTIAAAANTHLQRALLHKGYITPQQLENKTFTQALLDQRQSTIIFRLLFSGADSKSVARLVDAVLVTLGVNPKNVPEIEKYEIFQKFSPLFSGLVYFLMGEKAYDSIFGSAGSPMLLAKGIFEAYGPLRIDGAGAVNLATNLHMLFQANPALTKGFHGEELAEVLKDAVQSGLLTSTADANVFLRQVMNILPVYGAVRDYLTTELKRKPTVDELKQGFKSVLETYSGVPFPRLAQQIRRDLYIKSLSPYGLFHAGLQRTNIQVPIAPDIYVKDDITLRQNILDSPVGNMVGATARIVQMYGKRGALGKLYDDILQGKMPFITPAEWISLATRSGVPGHVAFAILNQHARNKSFLTPELIQGVRAAQFQYDIAPVLDQINAMYPDPELRAGALAEYAEKLGYKGVGNIDPGTYMMLLHSNAVHSGVKQVLQEADRFAVLGESTAHLANRGMVRSISDYVQQVYQKKLRGEPVKFNIGEAIGAVPVERYGIPREYFIPGPIKLPETTTSNSSKTNAP